jgi:two-component system OmpR family sensor kinase
MDRSLVPIAAAALGLAGSLAATFALHRAATSALDGVLEQRLRGAGETAAALLGGGEPTAPSLRAIMEANQLDGAYLVSPALEVLADATGPAPVRADLLRVDAQRVGQALRGAASVARAYDVGPLSVETAYFPVRAPDGAVVSVLALEAGRTFSEARRGLRGALALGIALALLGAASLAVAAARQGRRERLQREAATTAARGEAVARMAAVVAHEIRNPLGIIQMAVDLVCEEAGPRLAPRDQERLHDVLGEVDRLRHLTDDFLDLSADRPLQASTVDVGELALEAARGSNTLHPELKIQVTIPAGALVEADPGRLRQVLANLLANAAQAGARTVEITGTLLPEALEVMVRDDGRGISPEARRRLFEPYATSRAGGTGLGLVLSKRIVERHGGSLALVSGDGPGAAFRIRLPRSA